MNRFRTDPQTIEPEFHFVWNGLRVRSQLRLTGLRVADAASGRPPDVEITLQPQSPAGGVDAVRPDRDHLALHVPGVARYVISDGSRVAVEPFSDADSRDVRLFLMGSALGALCHQRGLFPLHASCVRVGEECVAFVGASGMGKSTLAACLTQAGYPLVSDDMTVLAADPEGRPIVHPGPGVVKVWREGLQHLREGTAGLERVRGGRDKFLLDVPTANGPLPLTRIYAIEDGDKPGFEPLTGMAGRFVVMQNIYRASLAGKMGLTPRLFRTGTSMANFIDVFRMDRVRGFDRMGDQVALLERHWAAPASGLAAVRDSSPTTR